MAPPNHEPSDIESKPQGPTLDELFEIARRASLKRRLRVTLVVALYVLCGFSGTVWYAYVEGVSPSPDGLKAHFCKRSWAPMSQIRKRRF